MINPTKVNPRGWLTLPARATSHEERRNTYLMELLETDGATPAEKATLLTQFAEELGMPIRLRLAVEDWAETKFRRDDDGFFLDPPEEQETDE